MEDKKVKKKKEEEKKTGTGQFPPVRNDKKPALIFLVVLFAAAAVIWAAFTAIRKQEAIGIAEGGYYYSIDQKSELPEGTLLKREEDRTLVEYEGHQYSLKSQMIYEENGATLLFQEDMLWYDRITDSMKKLPYFTRMKAEGDSYVFTKGSSVRSVSSGFLYDNGDLYVILEEAVLSGGGQTMSLAPMTVISCAYQDSVQIVTPEGDCTYLEQPGQELSVTFEDGCVLTPLTDTYYQANGTWRLLFTTVSMVPEL